MSPGFDSRNSNNLMLLQQPGASILERVNQELAERIGAPAASVLLRNPVDESLIFVNVRGDAHTVSLLTGERIEPDTGIIGASLSHGETLRVTDVRRDPAFSQHFDDLTHYKTGSVLAAPVRYRGELVGAIEFIRPHGTRAFSRREQKRFEREGIILDFAGDVLHAMQQELQSSAPKLRNVEGTVFFADMVNFKHVCRSMGDMSAAQMIETWLQKAMPVLTRYSADAVKTTGDGLLAVFLADESAMSHKVRAVRCALELRDAARIPGDEGSGEIKFRYGINSGTFVMGLFGNRTVDCIGDVLNTAAMLEAASLPGHISASPETLDGLSEDLQQQVVRVAADSDE